jgi:glycosyltransferase involved in cell wall biosynthesis
LLFDFIKNNKREPNNNITQSYLNYINEYVSLIERNALSYIQYNEEINKPKISFISTVFNKENYLSQLITSIQNQILKEFEIIFIDDCSDDKSIIIINRFKKMDKRIKLIKNNQNRGTLYSRSQGAIHSKGEYIIFIDSDDLILQKGLYNSYNYIKNNNLSMIQFNSIFKRNETLIFTNRYYKYENIITQPILSYLFYYNEKTKRGDELNTALWDKLINRDTAIKAINFIGNDYIQENVKIENDVILLYSLFRMSDSYQYINETAYFYIRNHNDSITNSWKNPNFSKSIVHGIFLNIKFLYEKSGDTYFDKLFSIFKLQQSFKRYIICFSRAKEEYEFVKKVLKILISSPYISKNDKIIVSLIEASVTNLMISI